MSTDVVGKDWWLIIGLLTLKYNKEETQNIRAHLGKLHFLGRYNRLGIMLNVSLCVIIYTFIF